MACGAMTHCTLNFICSAEGNEQDTYFLCKDKDPETHLESKALFNYFYNVLDKVWEEIFARLSESDYRILSALV